MKVLVTGVRGQLGYDVVKELAQRGIEAVGADIDDFDITNSEETLKFITDLKPDAVIHCAAYTAVDRAEDDAETCRKVNVTGSGNIAKAAAAVGAKIVYISTDYVYEGEGDTPFEVTDKVAPLSVYGKTKLEGENAVRAATDKYFIVRTSWVFGKNGNNFIKTMLRVGADHPVLTVVDDQIGSPTYTVDLARLVCDMIMTEKYGIYHGTNENFCSWAEFASEIFKEAGMKTEVKFVSTEEYGISKAKRPHNSRLSKKNLDDAGFKRLPSWQDALKRYLKEIKVVK